VGKAEFELGILYTTIAVMQPGEDFNDWNNTHVNQGFSWRPMSVSFGTLSDRPLCQVVVRTAEFCCQGQCCPCYFCPFQCWDGWCRDCKYH